MGNRESEMRELARSIATHAGVKDAWIAKSFNDLLLILDLPPGEPVPEDVRTIVERNGLEGSNQVYGTDDENESFVGAVADADRYQFVDLQSKGDYTSFTAPG